MLKIKMYQAGNGDAFLVRASGKNVLVDGGYAATFHSEISADLQEIAAAGEALDLVVATHIDADHISGLIALLGANKSSKQRKVVPIGQIWHNSLRSITAKNTTPLTPKSAALLQALSRRGHPLPSIGPTPQEISARQGSSLAALLHGGGYDWNFGDGTTSIRAQHTPPMALGTAGTVTVIGPNDQRLDELQLWWKAKLRSMGYSGPTGADDVIDDAFEFLCSYAPEARRTKAIALSGDVTKRLEEVYEPDTSITNASSIAIILELQGRRLLFLGDAWAEDVLEQLKLLEAAGQSMTFDAIKISHHGSLRNTSPDLLALIDAPIYFISSNGVGHGHPDFEVLAAIVDRPAAFKRHIYLNYETSASVRLAQHTSRKGSEFTTHVIAPEWVQIG